jgi:hypothetical protein
VATSVNAQATFLDGDEIPAADLRREIFGGVFPRAGIVSGLKAVATPTPSMAVRLPAGLCLVDDGAGGFVPLYLLTQTDLDIAPSDASLPRRDSVIAEVVDTGDPATLVRRFRVITGIPASSPVAPALPPADQPTATTLRLANVFVQAAAETHGNVRPQDVSTVAPSVVLGIAPTVTNFVTKPSFSSVGSYVDFTSGQWPAATLTVPSSGAVKVTISAGNLSNANTSTSTIRIAYRISGSNTVTADPLDSKCVLATGTDETSMSRTAYISGLTPGGTITVTPQWRISSGTSGDISLDVGQLLVEPVA